eukprot:COSAG01_NODE_65693_length_272_cov_1.069364_1_plen_24_part_01
MRTHNASHRPAIRGLINPSTSRYP